MKSFFNTNNIPLQTNGSICADGALAMLENRTGFVTFLKNEISNVAATHCILHRQALVSKTLPVTQKNEINSCVKIINYIRGRALNHRWFEAF